MERASILITGGNGFIGSHLVRSIARTGRRVAATYHSHPDRIPADLARLDAVEWLRLDLEHDARTATVLQSRIAIDSIGTVIHCAALADLSAAERDPDRTEAVNVNATRSLARLANNAGARFIFLSTDQVFDGTKSFYAENEPLSPINVYGQSKVDAEHTVNQESEPGCAISLRVSLVYGTSPARNRTASEQIINGFAQGLPLRLFTDEFRTPTFVYDIAQSILRMLEMQDHTHHWPPLLHLAGPDRVSRYEFGRILAKLAGHDASCIGETRQADLDLGMRRPADLSLSIELARQKIGYSPYSVVDGLRKWLAT